MNDSDKRLIEEYLPIDAVGEEASKEKSVRKSHISMIHLWWARRPLTACRAAVYSALVPADRFTPNNAPEGKRESLTRANAARFVKGLCTHPAPSLATTEARKHIFAAHAERLSASSGHAVTADEVASGKAPRPKLLDMFAGGGAIPLESLRLGCETYALDLNPVAHVIELCTLVFPQKYGSAAVNWKGCASDGSWAGLSQEVRHWGEWVLARAKEKVGSLYPGIPDPAFKKGRSSSNAQLWESAEGGSTSKNLLVPVAYLWTRTVTCKNPACNGTVALLRQTWLCKRKKQFSALRARVNKKDRTVRYEVVEALSEKALGFDPAAGSKGGNAICPFCGTVADSDYVKAEACAHRLGLQPLCVVGTRRGSQGKYYVSVDDAPAAMPPSKELKTRLEQLSAQSGLKVPDEPIEANPRSMDTQHFGFGSWAELFTDRQLVTLLTIASLVRATRDEMRKFGYSEETIKAVGTCLALLQSTITNSNSTICRWIPQNQQMGSTFSRQALPMTWDFAEINPLGGASGDTGEYLDRLCTGLEAARVADEPANLKRGSATELPYPDEYFDAIITDPPYYDNVSYSNLSDFFYVWLKRTIGDEYPEHFAAKATPKKNEAIAAFYRHGGDKDKARCAYERMMESAFQEASRVLRSNGSLVVVYAHKTTLGWSTLVDSLRRAGFMVTEAWPLDTEKPGRLMSQEAAALASSIFLAARKREGSRSGEYETDVRPNLERIVRERVNTLWDLGISGADLVIACVGAGLRAFTRFARVEYANGEEVPSQRFLTEVESVVLEAILARLSKEVGANGGRHGLASVDASTRFYTLWRYTYKGAELESGEAIIFANGTHVELDGIHGLATGGRALLKKLKGKYRLLDYSERGDDQKLGIPMENGQPAPVIDALHRLLWLMEKHPSGVRDFLKEAQPNADQLRLVAQALAGPALKGGELGEVAIGGELAALTKLTANWRSVVEDSSGFAEREDRRTGQSKLRFEKGDRR